MKPVIALTREMGALGTDVAEGLRDALGLPVIYHQIANYREPLPRAREGTLKRMIERTLGRIRTSMPDTVSAGHGFYTAEDILEMAMAGGVILCGWGAASLLMPIRHVIKVRIQAPMDVRVCRVMDKMGTDDSHFVWDIIRRDDSEHAEAIRRHMDVEWEKQAGYDLVLDTGELSPGQCVGQIVGLLESSAMIPTPGSIGDLTNLLLAARVVAILKGHPITRDATVAAVATGAPPYSVITLRGLASSDEQRRAAENLSLDVAGVAAVENRIELFNPEHVHNSTDWEPYNPSR